MLCKHLIILRKENRKLGMRFGKAMEHHLQEISPQYWQHHTGLTRPEAKQVIELLSTQRFLDFHSVEENDDSIDFSLPENVTDYVLCVSFDEDGNVEDISMES